MSEASNTSDTAAKPFKSKDPLHGLTLEAIVTALVDYFGWEELGHQIEIRCFVIDPSIASSLKFLRKTPWARTKVESLYLFMLREQQRQPRP
ncbi:VF530 family protein [Paucibacter sp. Y2R2-4]|uniref:VF530 family protein n=1 Tax=Paucibacter sp. Y2R2-4 TaxID=2893553 RepID=UPI0021E3B766|nr:VF530 family protein [Paucibacter sp. Y2R2-4]MCV2351889.1 VF530 family protein [Paucibacter sp. Y2R2-4]